MSLAHSWLQDDGTEIGSLYPLHPEPLSTFWYYIRERWAIRQKRLAGEPKPWTQDPTLRDYKFTNVFREHDRVTMWIDEHIRQPFKDHPNLWFMLCIARQINWPDTLQMLIEEGRDDGRFPGCWPYTAFLGENLGWALDDYKSVGNKVYTGAYMIRAESDPKKPWFSWSKQQYMGQIVLGRVWEQREAFKSIYMRVGAKDTWPTMEEVHAWLMTFHGWGGFMSQEVVMDLRQTRYLKDAPDWWTWAYAGPGAIRGLQRAFPNIGFRNAAGYLQGMRVIRNLSDGEAELRDGLPDLPPLDLHTIEFILCEFDKYSRVKHGEGRPRALFQGSK